VSAAALAPLSTQQQNEALQAASAELNGRLGDQYIFPLKTWGYDLVVHTCEVAAWYLLKARGFNPSNGLDLAIRKGYEDAIKWAQDVAEGKVQPDSIVDSSVGVNASTPRTQSNAPINSGNSQYRGF
jgi:phage gp36-like protein